MSPFSFEKQAPTSSTVLVDAPIEVGAVPQRCNTSVLQFRPLTRNFSAIGTDCVREYPGYPACAPSGIESLTRNCCPCQRLSNTPRISHAPRLPCHFDLSRGSRCSCLPPSQVCEPARLPY